MNKVIAGNWKMHHGPGETRDFFRGFAPSVAAGTRVLVFPPAVSLVAAVETAADGIDIGIQNVHWEEKGAFTGEHAVGMAVEAGAGFALIGHSERRHVFGETDAEVSLKVAAVQAGGLVPVVCVGETLEERRTGRLREVLLRQLDAALEGLGSGNGEFMIAYEPVWAIGTGETATPADAADAHGMLRTRLAAVVGAERAGSVPILYGGSVKPANAEELLAARNVDGVLVGGASLEVESFTKIAESA